MLKQMNWKSASATLLLTALLAGCGNSGEQSADAGGAAQAAQGSSNTTGQAAAGGAQQGAQTPDRTADLMGQIVSVSADAIVIQKTKVQPADMPEGGQGGFGGGRRGGQQGLADGTAPQNGEMPEGAGAPPEGQMQDGAGGTGNGQSAGGAAGGRRPEGGSGGGGFGQMELSDEQVTVKLSSETALTSMSFGRDQNNASAQLTAADLQAGDMITVWLNPDQSTAQTVLLRRMPNRNGEAGGQQ